MRYLHTMIRVTDLQASAAFFVEKLGMIEVRRSENEKGRFTLVFFAAPDDLAAAREAQAPLVEMTYNWDPEAYGGGRNFGHLAYEVDNIYDYCAKLQKAGVTINRLHPHARQHFDRTAAEGRRAAARRAVGFGAEHRGLVSHALIFWPA